MTLEIQKSSRRAHRTYRSNKSNSLAGVVEGACGVGLDGQLDLLNCDVLIWILGVRHRDVFILSFHKLPLSSRTCILTPETLHINCTVITSSSHLPENTIDLDIRAYLLNIIIEVTAAHLTIPLSTLS